MDIYIVTDSCNSETRAFYREADARKCAADLLRECRRNYDHVETVSTGRAWNVYTGSWYYIQIDCVTVE